MDRFTLLKSIVAPFPEIDMDTDFIYPAWFLLHLDPEELGTFAFADRRRTEPDTFVLDRPEYQGVQILATGAQFGVGSSCEQAVWALLDLGIHYVIVPSFGETFKANCLKNGLLPVELGPHEHTIIMNAAVMRALVTVDLERQTLSIDDKLEITFAVCPRARQFLLDGVTEIKSKKVRQR